MFMHVRGKIKLQEGAILLQVKQLNLRYKS